jgi:3-hydroxypropanoate dehydrogenase
VALKSIASDESLDLAFRNARSYNRWDPAPIGVDTIRSVFDLMKLGPTSANCSPARFVFVRSKAAKTRLSNCVSKNNRVKVEQSAMTVLIGMDAAFADKLPYLFPHAPDARRWFADPEVARTTALRNSSLQGAYFMIAARMMGLDCGPMSGFDQGKVDSAFFATTSVTTNFICALGHGTTEQLFPRGPRLAFDEICRFE